MDLFEVREVCDKDLKTSITLDIMNALPDCSARRKILKENLWYIGTCPSFPHLKGTGPSVLLP